MIPTIREACHAPAAPAAPRLATRVGVTSIDGAFGVRLTHETARGAAAVDLTLDEASALRRALGVTISSLRSLVE